MTKEITGVVPPIITTFDENGEFDPKRMKNLVKYVEKGGIKGIFVCGTYGSGPLMSIEERKKVLETVMETVSPDTTIIVHVGAANPQDSFDLARHAASVGADAISSVVPFYYSHAYNDDNVVSFFASLINTVNIPVLIYNNPKASGYTLTIPLLKELYKEGIAGVKDSSFDLLFFYSVKFNFDLSKLIYIVGTEAFILPTVPLGAKATIAGLANPFPQIVVNAFDAAKKGEYKDAFKIQEKVVELREIQHFAQSIPAIHAFFDILGIDTGYPRKPFKKVDEETKRKINDALKKVL